MEVPAYIIKRRVAVERWKLANRAYYLHQKRVLAARPSYRAKMRANYAAHRAALKEAGILPRKLGRPVLYTGQEALDRQKERAREASARYRQRQIISQAKENHESTTPSPDRGKDSDRCSDCSGCSA